MLSPYRFPAVRKPDRSPAAGGTGLLGAAIVLLFFALLLALARQHGLTL